MTGATAIYRNKHWCQLLLSGPRRAQWAVTIVDLDLLVTDCLADLPRIPTDGGNGIK